MQVERNGSRTVKTGIRIWGAVVAAIMLTGCVETGNQLPGDALVPGTGYNATGRIPCTNQVGPTMFDCEFGVVRRGGGTATVVVTLPTGNERRIFFENGTPSGSDAPVAARYRRMGDETLIAIGNVERYRIFDAVVYGG